jgi:hypothetical protein
MAHKETEQQSEQKHEEVQDLIVQSYLLGIYTLELTCNQVAVELPLPEAAGCGEDHRSNFATDFLLSAKTRNRQR